MRLTFADYEIDLRRSELRQGGTRVPVEPQVFDLLAFLAENSDRLVTRREIVDAVWDGRFVSEAAVDSRIRSARVAIGDDNRDERWLKTVRGRGFLFSANVERVEDQEPAAAVVTSLQVSEPDEPAPERGGRPSIAVLPFIKMSPDWQYAPLSDALPHDVIAALSRLRWLFVIARASSFQFSAGSDPVIAARRLGVRYVLTGSVDALAGHVTITVELADTERGGVVWAESYTGRDDDVHQMRTQIVSAIVNALELRIPLAEADTVALKAPDALDAWGAYHLGIKHIYRCTKPDTFLAAQYFTRSTELDPQFARGYAGLSLARFQSAFSRYSDDVSADTLAATRAAEKAVEMDPLDPFAGYVMGRTSWIANDLDTANAWFGRALDLNPNFAQCFYTTSLVKLLRGDTADVTPGIDTACSLSPLDPLREGMLMCKAFGYVMAGDLENGVRWAERAMRSPAATLPVMNLLAAVAHDAAGNEEVARSYVQQTAHRAPHYTIADFFNSMPFSRPADRQRIADALRRLGQR